MSNDHADTSTARTEAARSRTSTARRLALPALAGAILLTACDVDVSLDDLDGSGDHVTETYAVERFTSVDVGDAFLVDIEVRSDAVASVEVTTDDNLIDRIDVEVRDGVLHIDEAGHRALDPSLAEVRIVVPRLEAIAAGGAGTIDVDGIDVEEFRVELSGARIVSLSGVVDRLEVEANGAALLSASDLEAAEVVIDLEGAAVADVHASDRVSGSTSGAVGLDVDGGADVDVDTSGLAWIDRG